MSVTEAEARSAWLAARRSRSTLGLMIADLLAEGREIEDGRLQRYRVAVAAEAGLQDAYDTHLERRARQEADAGGYTVKQFIEDKTAGRI